MSNPALPTDLPARTGTRGARRRLVAAAALALGILASGVPAGALPMLEQEVPWLLKSDNVEWHGNIPLDYPGVGGQVVDHADGNRYFYANGGKGITVYDISDPLLPLPVGNLAFPYSQGENLQVSADGTRAVLAADGFLPFLPNYVTTGVHVADFSDPTMPAVIASTNDLAGGRVGINDVAGGVHTVACADDFCDYAYGSDGLIYDLTASDEGTVEILENRWVDAVVDDNGDPVNLGTRHALNRDETGLMIADTVTRVVLDVTGEYDPAASPTNPVAITTGTRSGADANIQHNNMRTGAADWTSRSETAPVETQSVELLDDRSTNLIEERPIMQPGELMIGTSESNINPQCSGTNGGISTWSMVNYDHGVEMQQLEFFAPYNGLYADEGGAPPAQWAGCSAHWFDVTQDEASGDYYAAASWYEHGTRFFKIGATTGTIEEVGYYQSVQGISAATYWISEDVVYTVDGTRGIDILRFNRDESRRPSDTDLRTSWLITATAASDATKRIADDLRAYCRLAVTS